MQFMIDPWQITLLGGLSGRRGGRTITRFRTQKTGALLGFLAYHKHIPQPREVVIDILWQDVDLDSGRGRLRVALTSLRHQLEPPGVPQAGVLLATRSSIQLRPEAFATDVEEFAKALEASRKASGDARIIHLYRAVELYTGSLLPGYYEPWILLEQIALEQRYFEAVEQLIRELVRMNSFSAAIDIAMRALRIDPEREESHRALIELYAAGGRPADASRHAEKLAALNEAGGSAMIRATPPVQIRPRSENAVSPRERQANRGAVDLLARERRGSSLPATLNSFVGREREIEYLHAMLWPKDQRGITAARIVSITGLGGSGKTRLAIEFAARIAAPGAIPVWFVPLTDTGDPSRIAGGIADVMGLPRSKEIDPFDQAAAALAESPGLLVLDNFEQLVDEGAKIISALIRRAPGAGCLVTTRRLLNIEGEREFALSTLSVPEASLSREHLADNESVQLFLDRAQEARPDFQLTRGNAAAVQETCARLEGLPLAIELAASRVRLLSPTQILEHLTERFAFLVSKKRDSDPRHQSLRATLEWSFDMLPPEQRSFLTGLATFRGGFTVEAACGMWNERIPRKAAPDSVLEWMEQCRECSLLLVDHSSATPRFSMLETVREYLLEEAEPSQIEANRNAHLSYCSHLGRQARDSWWGPDEEAWLSKLELEHGNIREALSWGLDRRPIEAINLALCAARFWFVHGHYREGRDWLMRGFERSEVGSIANRAALLSESGALAREQGDQQEGIRLAEASMALWEEAGDRGGYATALQRLGLAYCDSGLHSEATNTLEQALTLQRELGNRIGIAVTLACLTRNAMVSRDFLAAVRFADDSLITFQEIGHQWGIAVSLYMQGECALNAGECQSAMKAFEESLSIHEQSGNRRGIALCGLGLGRVALRMDRTEEAKRLLNDCLARFREIGSAREEADTLEALAHLRLRDAAFRD